MNRVFAEYNRAIKRDKIGAGAYHPSQNATKATA